MGPGPWAIAAPAISTAPIANPTRTAIETLISLFPFPSPCSVFLYCVLLCDYLESPSSVN
jgi:hypothetical protein